MRPIDQKMKYQIDKMIKAATTGIAAGKDCMSVVIFNLFFGMQYYVWSSGQWLNLTVCFVHVYCLLKTQSLHRVGIKVKPCIKQLLTGGEKTIIDDKSCYPQKQSFLLTRGSHFFERFPNYKFFTGGSWFGVWDSCWLLMEVF